MVPYNRLAGNDGSNDLREVKKGINVLMFNMNRQGREARFPIRNNPKIPTTATNVEVLDTDDEGEEEQEEEEEDEGEEEEEEKQEKQLQTPVKKNDEEVINFGADEKEKDVDNFSDTGKANNSNMFTSAIKGFRNVFIPKVDTKADTKNSDTKPPDAYFETEPIPDLPPVANTKEGGQKNNQNENGKKQKNKNK